MSAKVPEYERAPGKGTWIWIDLIRELNVPGFPTEPDTRRALTTYNQTSASLHIDILKFKAKYSIARVYVHYRKFSLRLNSFIQHFSSPVVYIIKSSSSSSSKIPIPLSTPLLLLVFLLLTSTRPSQLSAHASLNFTALTGVSKPLCAAASSPLP